MEKYFQVSISEELDRNPELKMEDVEAISDWMESIPDLPIITHIEIIQFLHSNYYNLEATKQTIVKYFDCRTNYKEYFKNLDLDSAELIQASEAL